MHVVSEEDGDEEDEELGEGEEFDEVRTESSGEEEGVAENISQHPQLDAEPKSTLGGPQAPPDPSFTPAASVNEVNASNNSLTCQLCLVSPVF